jgi:hypothetical protein
VDGLMRVPLVVGGLLVLAVACLSSVGVAAQTPGPVDEHCLDPALVDTTTLASSAASETLTNRLFAPPRIPDPVRLRVGTAPHRYTLELETRLDPDLAGVGSPTELPNFEVIGSLQSSAGEAHPDAVVVTAAAADLRRILVPICLDPRPTGGALHPGVYRATVTFVDPRIPETTFAFDVWVGGESGWEYAAVGAGVGLLLLAVFPVVLLVAAAAARRSGRDELGASRPWLIPLLVVVAAGYVWALLVFRDTERFHLWSVSLEGARELLVFAVGKVTVAVTGVIALITVIPTWRETTGKLLSDKQKGRGR